MTLNKKNNGLRPLASSIGDFIRYWGFRRIHGQIWTMIYTSKNPLSGADLSAGLKVSKALISKALKELEDHELIIQVESENSKTKRYAANPEVFKVIQKVLINREMQILHRISASFDYLQRSNQAAPDDNLDPQRMKELGDMIKSANKMMTAFVELKSPETLSMLALLLSGEISD